MSEQVEQYDEVCQVCGASMGATHAPWCQSPDGTPVPEILRETLKAKHEAEQAIERMVEAAPDYDVLVWVAGELLETLGTLIKTVPITSDREVWEKYFALDEWELMCRCDFCGAEEPADSLRPSWKFVKVDGSMPTGARDWGKSDIAICPECSQKGTYNPYTGKLEPVIVCDIDLPEVQALMVGEA